MEHFCCHSTNHRQGYKSNFNSLPPLWWTDRLTQSNLGWPLSFNPSKPLSSSLDARDWTRTSIFISFSFRPQLLDVIGSVVTLSSVHQTALEIIGSNSELHERYLWALGQQTRPSSEVAESKLSESRVGEIPPAVDRSSRKSQAGFFGQTPRAGFSEWMTTLVESKCFLSELVINFSSDARLMSQLLVT